MTVISEVISKIKKWFALFIGLMFRLICWKKKHRRNSGTLLPVFEKTSSSTSTAINRDPHNYQQPQNSQTNYSATQSYNNESYGNYSSNYNQQFVQGASSSFSNIPNPSNTGIIANSTVTGQSSFASANQHQTANIPNSQANNYSHNHDNNKESDEGEDFFRDMAPAIKKQRRIYVPTMDNKPSSRSAYSSSSTASSQSTNRLSVDLNASFEIKPELGDIIDDHVKFSSWEDDTYAADELGNMDETLNQARINERMRRLAEHRRVKIEREQRKAKSLKSNFVATKLS